jgi:hypothetical protein
MDEYPKRWLRQVRALRGCPCVVTALLLGLIGCAAQYRHLDGSRFTPVGRPVPLPEGWIVVDSTAGGIHALIELQTEALEANSGALQTGFVAFRLAPSAAWSPGRVRVEGPFCLKNRPPRGLPQPDDQGNRVMDVTGSQCSYVVRAEFALDRRPMRGDSVTVVYGRATTHLTWP